MLLSKQIGYGHWPMPAETQRPAADEAESRGRLSSRTNARDVKWSAAPHMNAHTRQRQTGTMHAGAGRFKSSYCHVTTCTYWQAYSPIQRTVLLHGCGSKMQKQPAPAHRTCHKYAEKYARKINNSNNHYCCDKVYDVSNSEWGCTTGFTCARTGTDATQK